MIKPIRTYEIELGDVSKNQCQQKILRIIADAPWNVSNRTLHKDFKIPYVSEIIKKIASRHHIHIDEHHNQILEILLQSFDIRRLKTLRPLDL